jgi:hypothetical protein
MDTTWFAVDRDGHVGLFSSGENGHVSERASHAGQEELQALLLARLYLVAACGGSA